MVRRRRRSPSPHRGRCAGVCRLDDAVLRRRLTEACVDADAAFAEATSLAVRQHMDQTKTLVTELHIEGTPAFVVGGTLVSGPEISQVEAALPRS